MKVLDTERLQLRHLESADAGFMLQLLNEPAFIRHIGDKGVRSLDQARDYILHKIATSYEKHGFGLYLVQLKDSGASLGICGLVKRDGLEDIDIGFAFLQQFWSRGYAFEAASAMMGYAQRSVGLKRIVAITAPDNLGSIALLEKLGLEFEKIVRLPRPPRDSKLFGMPFAAGHAP